MIARLSGKSARPRSTGVQILLHPKMCRCEVPLSGTALLSSIMIRPAVNEEIPKTWEGRASRQRYKNSSVRVYELAVGRVRLGWKAERRRRLEAALLSQYRSDGDERQTDSTRYALLQNNACYQRRVNKCKAATTRRAAGYEVLEFNLPQFCGHIKMLHAGCADTCQLLAKCLIKCQTYVLLSSVCLPDNWRMDRRLRRKQQEYSHHRSPSRTTWMSAQGATRSNAMCTTLLYFLTHAVLTGARELTRSVN